ncbi:MAG: hypothetical protein H7Z75_14390, partial [Ferruginibacter sp.]|nr:hypothetical protein [Cytophagales bacterium]
TDAGIEVTTTQREAVYKLTYSSELEGTVKVHLYDAQGSRLYTDFIGKAKTFTKHYDFNGLASGEYRFEIVGVEGKQQRTVQYVPATPIAKAGLKVSVAALEETGKFALKVQRKQTAPVLVSIYNDRNELIYEDRIQANQNFSRVYDLSKSFAKAAAFEVYTDGATIRQAVR